MGPETQVNVKNMLTFSKRLSNMFSLSPPTRRRPSSQPASLFAVFPPLLHPSKTKKKKPGESEEKEAGEEERQVWVNAEMSPNAAHHRL